MDFCSSCRSCWWRRHGTGGGHKVCVCTCMKIALYVPPTKESSSCLTLLSPPNLLLYTEQPFFLEKLHYAR